MALTKEEKKAKKEAKRLEKLRLEAELKKKMRRDELTREMAAQAVKRGELDRTWREMMLKIKEPIFKQDIEVMWHTFERAYDKKDHLINHIKKLIDIADDQTTRAVASFCDMVDKMILKFQQDLEDMSKDNERRTNDLLKWGQDIRDRLTSEHNAAELHLQILLFHGKNTSENYIWNMKGENMVKEDEERNLYMDIRDNLRSFLENSYNTMWDDYKLVLRNYVSSTAENQKHVRRLRHKENLMADIIASQAKKIANSDGILKRLKAELAMYESGSKQAVFRDRRDRHRAAAYRLKRRLLAGLATDDQRLITLVKASDSAIEWIQIAQEKGLKILRLSALCRKFETQREKVLPFGTDIAAPPTPKDNAPNKNNPRAVQSNESLCSHVSKLPGGDGLTKLWQRMAKAELGKRALQREKQLLERENEMLILQLEAMNDASFTDSDTLTRSAICECTNKKKGRPHIVAIDGSLELNKYR